MTTAQHLHATATAALLSGDHEGALHAFAALCRVQPMDLDARLRVGDALLGMGEVQAAARVYTTLAGLAANSGYPLRALVALKVLEALEPQLGELLGGVAVLYAKGSPRLGRGARPALGDRSVPVSVDLARRPPRPELVAAAVAVATSTQGLGPLPPTLPPIPLFSELPADAFSGVLRALELRRRRPGEVILQQGEAGHAFYVVARGTVEVSRASGGDRTVVASLSDGAIFGEMALVSAQPRTATVTAKTDVDLLEFDRAALEAASRSVGLLAAALQKFTRERMLNNLLATSPLFRPFDRDQRLDLVRRFTAHDLAPGTSIIREGEEGRGLFIVLSGQVDVSKRDGQEKVLLATLGPGEVFGEIALLHEQTTTATVEAATPTTVLFLARELFQRLVDAVGEIRDYIENLGDERLMDTRLTMQAGDVEELGDDDLVLI